jgi:putative ABC transport system permease protein
LVNKLVFENLKHRPVRTFLSMFAIGVEVTMMLTLVGLCYGMLDDTQRRHRGIGADAFVRSPGTSFISLSTASMDERLVALVARQPHVKQAVGALIWPIKGISSITGIDLQQFNQMSGGLKFVQGGLPQKSDDILVDEDWARQNKLSVGSSYELLNSKWRVCGIVEPGKLARVFLPLRILQEKTSSTGKLSQIYVKVDNRANLPGVLAGLKQMLPDYPILSLEELISLFSVDQVPGLTAFIYVVIGLSMVVGFLVVFLSMYTAVLERTREIGILKALGASPAYVLNVLLRETAVLAVVGSAVGILLTYGTRALIKQFASATLRQDIVYEWWIYAALIAMAGALLGSLYPGWKAARQDAIEALSYE